MGESITVPDIARPTRIGITGLSSNVGKTTLLCRLLELSAAWEAIKISRGHYRSCGKNPQACCISPLLGERPLILSGRRETYAPGKDTGRYWEAGAGNVHWVICSNDQVEEGARIALSRVETEGVFIEGTSFLKYIQSDYSILVVHPSRSEIKSSVLSVLDKMDAVFASGSERDPKFMDGLRERLQKRGGRPKDLPVYFESDLGQLAAEVRQLHLTRRGRIQPGLQAK